MELSKALEIEQKLRAVQAEEAEGNLSIQVYALLAIIDDLRGTENPAEIQGVIDAYHKHLPMLPKVSAISQPRKKKIVAQWKANQKGKPPGQRVTLIDFWDHTFAYAARSEFLTGARANDRGWRPNIDFFLQASSLTKLREGYYHAGNSAQKTGTWF